MAKYRRWVTVSILLGSMFGYALQTLAATPAEILLAPASEIKKISVLKKLKPDSASSFVERIKIEYLIARIKNSAFSFIRNGEEHTSKRAAMHLMWKYRKRFNDIKTAVDFIDKVASGSWLTGEQYKIKMPDGNTYPTRDILMNELAALDAYLQNEPPAPSASPALQS